MEPPRCTIYGWFDTFVMIRQNTVSQWRYCGTFLIVSHFLFPVIFAQEQIGLDEASLHCDVRHCSLHFVTDALQTKLVAVNLKRSTFCFIFFVCLHASHDNTFTIQCLGM